VARKHRTDDDEEIKVTAAWTWLNDNLAQFTDRAEERVAETWARLEDATRSGPSPEQQEEENIRGPGERHEIQADDCWIRLYERHRITEHTGHQIYNHVDLEQLADPGKVDGDAPQLDPEHQDHEFIAWFECYYPRCSDHQWQKLQHRASPIKNIHEPTKTVHEYNNDGEWDVSAREPRHYELLDDYPEHGYSLVLLEARATASNDCARKRVTWWECPNYRCTHHMYQKLLDWQQNQKPRNTRKAKQREDQREQRHWHNIRHQLPWRIVGEYGTLTPRHLPEQIQGNDRGGIHAPDGSN
jgi:hypothetical protein